MDNPKNKGKITDEPKGKKKMTEIARVTKGNNNIETARAFAKCECFKFNTIAEIAETMRAYKRSGMLIFTETEAILYHDC